MSDPKILATDLDGTLIPFAHVEENRRDLETLSREIAASNVTLVFVTGRHFESIERAIPLHALPVPEWIVCNVGTSLYMRQDGGGFVEVIGYRDHLAGKIERLPIADLRDRLIGVSGLKLQEEEKQGRYKLSYYCEGSQLRDLELHLNECLAEWSAPYRVITSIDPYNGDGLIDLLPAGVDKAYGLTWWADHAGWPHDDVVFAGDSGNDLAAFVAGYRVIVVSNASEELIGIVRREHEERNFTGRLFFASKPATSGVLEGCRWYGLIGD